ncbi:MAG: glycosyltransferase [Spirochaetes bacterium]|nr:glycosyltransferase [Spirochaetota bacterium]
MNNGYSVILPTYREFENLRILIPELAGMIAGFGLPFEILVIDDDSRDGTEELVRDLSASGIKTRIIVRKDRRGLASAILEGTNQALFDTIIHMDSDLAHRVEDLQRLIACYRNYDDENHIVIGSRYSKNSSYTGKPFLNRLASLTGRNLIKLYLGLPVNDSSNNFRIFSQSMWNRVHESLIPDGNVMLIQFLYQAHKAGAIFNEMDTIYIERRLGQSKLKILNETVKFFKHMCQIKR